jgi:threonine/homoserine/homoserine lactone efflux protein
VTNPKTIVFFAAVLPQFVDRGQGHVAVQILLLGLVFNIIAVASDMVWGLARPLAGTGSRAHRNGLPWSVGSAGSP